MMKIKKIISLLLITALCSSFLFNAVGAEEPLTKTINANVALNKYVYAGDGNAGPEGKGQTLTDGRRNVDYNFYMADTHVTRNATLNDYSGLLPSGALGVKATASIDDWYMIDLGRKYNITQVKLYAHSTWDETAAIGATSRYMSNVEVQVSNSEDFAVFESLIDIETATWDEFPYAESDFEGKKPYRYVRIKKTAATEHGYSELEVFADVTLTEISRGKDVSANVVSYESYPAEEVNDGIVESGNGWLVESGTAPFYLTVDLGEEYPVSWIEMIARVTSTDNEATRYGWNVYGAKEAPEESTITEGNSLIPTIFTGYNGNTVLFPKQSEGSLSMPVFSKPAEETHRYLTFYKTANNVALSEIRAYVVNPEIIKSEISEGMLYLEFSEEMEAPENNITVYNITDGETVLNPSIEVLNDGRIKVGVSELYGKDIRVTVDGNTKNMKGVALGADQSFMLKTPKALVVTGFTADKIMLLDEEDAAIASLSEAKAAEMEIELENKSSEELSAVLIIAAYDAYGNLLACTAEKKEIGLSEETLSARLPLDGLIGVTSVTSYLIDDYSTLSAWESAITRN